MDAMKVPAGAIIKEDKFTRYLLVKREFDDKSQFLAGAGFNPDNYILLIDQIRMLISREDAVEERSDEYGTFYKVSGSLTGPDNISIKVTTVWLQRKVDGLFQFVTLIPYKRG